jgi:hypothetical protein
MEKVYIYIYIHIFIEGTEYTEKVVKSNSWVET